MVDYVYWHEALDEREKKIWAEFLAGGKAEKDALEKRLREFRFPGEPAEWPDPETAPPDQPPPSLADPAKRIILGALGIEFYEENIPELDDPPAPF